MHESLFIKLMKWILLFGKIPKHHSQVAEGSPLLNGLVHYWTLDEQTGNRLDSVRTNAIDLAPVGTVGYSEGIINNGLALDSADGSSYVGANSDISIDPTGFTVWGWIKSSVMFGTMPIIYVVDETPGRLSFALYWDSIPQWYFLSMESISFLTRAAVLTEFPSADTWYFACGRYNPITHKLELRINDGSWIIGEEMQNPPLIPTNGVLRLGSSIGGGGIGLQGTIDGVGIANRYYSDVEVDILWNNGLGIDYPFD